MIKGLIHKKYIIIRNIYVPHIRVSKYKQILTDLKGIINKNTIIIRNFNIPLSTMGKSCKVLIRKHLS